MLRKRDRKSVFDADGICSPSALPAGADTFTQMYAPDGNHPSEAGTYLEGLLIASSLTGELTEAVNGSCAKGAVHPLLSSVLQHSVYRLCMQSAL
jgi:hypothetical protein